MPRLELLVSALFAIAASAPARAEPIGEDVTVHEATTAPPGAESGRSDAIDREPSTLRLIGRGLLFVPRTIVDVAFMPVQGALYLYDRYQLKARFERIFFNDAMTMGLYPTVELESGFGVNGGARFVHRDLFGEREHVAVRAVAGGRYQARVSADVRTGHRLGRVGLELGGELDRRPHDPFYGIGDTGGAEARHRQELWRARGAIDVRAVSALHLRLAGALSDLSYGAADEAMGTLYDPMTLTGWTGVRHVYGELELRWDNRRQADLWDAPSLVSAGSLASVFAGRTHQLTDARGYWRFGVDVQHFWRLGVGPRVLVTRLHGEAVGDGDVAFTELPQLGGKTLLRGYPADRFRDRVAALGSVEYQWDLARHATTCLFVDAGRVYAGLDELSGDGLRVGYGIGLQIQSTHSFIAQASLASSIDGGVFLNLAFDPVFEVSPREERR